MDKSIINSVTGFLAFGVLASQIVFVILLVFLLISWFSKKKIPVVDPVLQIISENSLALGFVYATIGMLGSLFLSEIAGYIPCELCWYQRICLYPQVVVLGVGFFMNDLRSRIYAIVLSIIGALIAIYHIVLQAYPLLLPCSDKTANCALVQFKYFGYITIPVMSLTGFALILLILLAPMVVRKKK